MLKGRMTGLLAVVLALALIAAACSDDDEAGAEASTTAVAEEAPTTEADKDPIKLGSVMPLTGDQAAVALSFADGYRAFFEYVNDNGGIDGRQIEWLIEDDGMQAARSIAGVQKLVQQDKVVLLTATYGTGNSLQVMPVAENLGIPLIAPIGFSTEFYRPTRDLVFPVFPGFLDIYPIIVDYMLETGSESFFILYRNDASGEESVQGYMKNLDESQVVDTVAFDPNITDFTTLAQRVVASEADTVLMFAAVTEIALAIQALRSQGFEGRLGDTLSAADAQVVELAGDVDLTGVHGLVLQDISGNAPGWADYVERLATYAPDADPNRGFTVTGYVNAIFVVEVLRRADGDYSPESLAAAAESIQGFETGGLTGPLTMGPDDHLASGSAAVTAIEDGKIVIVTDFFEITP